MKGLSVAGSFAPDEQGVYRGEIDPDWCQGRTAFGGLLATAAVRSMQHRLEGDRPLRSVLTTFVAPVSAGPLRIEVEPLRAGRSLTSLDARVMQAGRIGTRVSACFGEGRETCIQIPGRPRPEAKPPEEFQPMPYVPDVTPAFTQHFDFRWVSPLPFFGAQEPRIQGWIRPNDDQRLDAAGLLSLVDAWPPPEIVTQNRPYPLSSVTWLVNLLTVVPGEGFSPDEWWFYESAATWADGGYSDSWAGLWSSDGTPVASSHQLVAEFTSDCEEAG